MCWYCYWGWADQVVRIFEKYDPICELEYGIGHTVWADENFETSHIEFCLSLPNDGQNDGCSFGYEFQVMALRELLLIDEKIRCCEPDDYDGENPENFPPAKGVVMSKKN